MNNESAKNYDEQIRKFLDEFIAIIYKGHDHIVARKYYHELFKKLIPKYFALYDEERKIENKWWIRQKSYDPLWEEKLKHLKRYS